MSVTQSMMHLQILTGTTSATPGTVTTHAHGLQRAPNIKRIFLTHRAATGNTDDAAAISASPDGLDATNIAVKSNKASATFTAFIFLNDTEPQLAGPSDANT